VGEARVLGPWKRERGQAELVDQLYERIGRLDMDLEWLKKKLSGLG
jgi:hypothetical protein